MFGIVFKYPNLLGLLVIPVILAGLWLWQRSKSQQYAVKFADVDLLSSLSDGPPTIKQVLPGISAIVSMVLVVIAIAGPQQEHIVPVKGATIILAFDTSISMQADDILPTRFNAAKEAAKQFVDKVPEDVRLGLVFFNATVTPAVPPTLSRTPITQALDNATTNFGTSLGDAIVTSISMINADSALYQTGDAPAQGEDKGQDTEQPKIDRAATIVLLSDGETTTGNPAEVGAKVALEASIKVNTISFGTKNGIISVDGRPQAVPANEGELRSIAKTTKGTFARALNKAALEDIFANLARTTSSKTEYELYVLPWLVGALGFAVLAMGAHIFWFRRAF